MLSHNAGSPPFWGRNDVLLCVCIKYFLYPLTADGHLDRSCTAAAGNTAVCTSLRNPDLRCFGYIPRRGVLGLEVILFLIICGTSALAPFWLHT